MRRTLIDGFTLELDRGGRLAHRSKDGQPIDTLPVCWMDQIWLDPQQGGFIAVWSFTTAEAEARAADPSPFWIASAWAEYPYALRRFAGFRRLHQVAPTGEVFRRYGAWCRILNDFPPRCRLRREAAA